MPVITTADGTELSYDLQGQGESLLLLSGQAQDHTLWDKVLPCLVQHFQVIRFDYRGTGHSTQSLALPYSTQLFAQDAVQLLEALALQRVHVWGYSMGGRVAQWLAIDYPTRVKSLILGATTVGKQGIPRDAEANLWLMSGDINKMSILQYSPEFAAQHPELLTASNTPPRQRQLHFKASETHDTLDAINQIQAPTLILHGSEDRINPTANAFLMAKHIPQAQVVIIEHGRHGFIDEYAEYSCELVSQFINRIGRE
jgi:pimeloyl-ACP methyl ester carboxylesterase